MRIMVSEQIIEEENSCSSTGGRPPYPNYQDEKFKPNLISTDSYNNIHEFDNSTSPHFN